MPLFPGGQGERGAAAAEHGAFAPEPDTSAHRDAAEVCDQRAMPRSKSARRRRVARVVSQGQVRPRRCASAFGAWRKRTQNSLYGVINGILVRGRDRGIVESHPKPLFDACLKKRGAVLLIAPGFSS